MAIVVIQKASNLVLLDPILGLAHALQGNDSPAILVVWKFFDLDDPNFRMLH